MDSIKESKGGDYFNQGGNEHWLVDSLISNPMSAYSEYKTKRTSWGIDVLGSIIVEPVSYTHLTLPTKA